MLQKNYYQLLQISPQATGQEIKAAYRKLVFKYHPDRNNGNTITEAVLKEINEAYGVLSNPEKRKFYNASLSVNNDYTQHRRTAAVSPQTILQDAITLRKSVNNANVFTIDQDLLFHKIKTLLSDFNVNIVILENNVSLTRQFLQQVMLAMQPLTLKVATPLFTPLKKLAARDMAMQKTIQSFYQLKKQDALWQRYKLTVVLIIVILLCMLIYFL